MRLRFLLILAPALAGAAHAAEPATSEEAMVKLCQGELDDQLFSGGPRGESFVTAQKIERGSDRVVVRLDVASGEGRRVSGSCIFRDGKLFDVK